MRIRQTCGIRFQLVPQTRGPNLWDSHCRHATLFAHLHTKWHFELRKGVLVKKSLNRISPFHAVQISDN